MVKVAKKFQIEKLNIFDISPGYDLLIVCRNHFKILKTQNLLVQILIILVCDLYFIRIVLQKLVDNLITNF